MKKALAVLGLLVVLIAAAAGAYYLGARSGTGKEITTTQPPDTQPTGPDIDSTHPPFEEMMVGLWQNAPSVGSGIGECYRFSQDGTYTFEPSPFVFDPTEYRPPSSQGTYQADGDSMTLLRTKNTVAQGGAWVEDPILGFVLEGGSVKTVIHPEPKAIYAIYLGVFPDLPREMLSIDGRTYWKLSGDPNEYLD